MKTRVLALVSTVAILTSPIPRLLAQGDTVIKSETRVVLVDAVAVDKKGHFARDLTAKDFRVLEDGKEQKISGVSLESDANSAGHEARHYIVLFFDTVSLTPARVVALRQDATQFVERYATPDRYFAVVAFAGGLKVLQNFTADPARVKAAVAQVQGWSSSAAGTMAPTAPVRGPRTAPGALDGSAEGALYREMLSSVRTTAGSVATARGRKALVIFSDGTGSSIDFGTEVSATIAACNKANVGVYAVTTAGLSGVTSAVATGSQQTGGTGGRLTASNTPVDPAAGNQNPIRDVAAGTGGLVLATSNGLADALGSVAQEQDEYYLITYTPAIESAEGSCHNLQVKTERSGLDIRARKSYCTAKTIILAGNKPAGQALEARAASAPQGKVVAKLQLPWVYAEPNVARVTLAMDIQPSAVKLQKDKGKWHGELELAGVAYKTDGSVAARLSDTLKVDFETQPQVDAFLGGPYHYSNRFEIVPGQYNFRLIVGSADQAFGKIDMPLTVEPWNGKTFSLSGITLSRDAHASTDLTAGLDDALLEGTHPLVARGIEVVPAGATQFRQGERGFLYFEIYRPDAAAGAVSLRLHVLDRASGAAQNDSGPVSADPFVRPGNPMIPVALALPVAGLPAGAYKVEVAVTRGETTVTRTADFDLN